MPAGPAAPEAEAAPAATRAAATAARETRAIVARKAGQHLSIRQTELDNGLRIVTERMEDVRSVALGFWVGTGARDEAPELGGASHFLEHLLFKGTERWSARDIAESVEAVGGDVNAFTAKEHTAFYGRFLVDDLGLGLDILCDIMRRPMLRAQDVEAERQVILEELLMHGDEPSDGVHDLLHEAVYGAHGLGREVLGTEDTVEGLERDRIVGFFTDHYGPGNLVVAAAGRIEHDELVDSLAKAYDEAAHVSHPPVRTAPPELSSVVAVTRRSTEQAHLVIGLPGVAAGDADRYALTVLNQALGGATSSRLFQEIRERRGLAYSVYSYWSAYADAGMTAIYAGTAPQRAGEVLACIGDEIERLAADGITERELEVATGHIRGTMALGLEDSGARMSRIGSSLVSLGEVLPVDEIVACYGAVTLEEVADVARRLFGGPRALAVIGPFDEGEFDTVGGA